MGPRFASEHKEAAPKYVYKEGTVIHDLNLLLTMKDLLRIVQKKNDV